jgi:hypothetical protein
MKKEDGIHTGRPGRPKRVTILSAKGELPDKPTAPKIVSQSTESKKAKEEHERKYGPTETGPFSQANRKGLFSDTEK